MLNEICAKLKNYFCLEGDKVFGDFSVVDGAIVPPVDIAEGQYYRIVGSVFNDGVHLFGKNTKKLVDEPKFHGAIWKMRVPKDVIDLAKEIEDWQAKYGSIESENMSPYTSESFGGYSYSKGVSNRGYGGGSGSAVTWDSVFMPRLSQYMRIRV